MIWNEQQLEQANNKYLNFSDGSTRLLRRSGNGWKIGEAHQAITTKVVLKLLNHQQARVADETLYR